LIHHHSARGRADGCFSILMILLLKSTPVKHVRIPHIIY
jgi:hypothetical protein